MNNHPLLMYVKNIAQDNNIKLSPKSYYAVAEHIDDTTSYDTIVKLLEVAYDNMGPKGLSVVLRLSDDEAILADELVRAYSTVFRQLTLRDVIIFGLKCSKREKLDIELNTGERRLNKRTIRINRELDGLIREAIADYSNEFSDISNSMAMLIGIHAAARQKSLDEARK